jgi:hypothetical protein
VLLFVLAVCACPTRCNPLCTKLDLFFGQTHFIPLKVSLRDAHGASLSRR